MGKLIRRSLQKILQCKNAYFCGRKEFAKNEVQKVVDKYEPLLAKETDEEKLADVLTLGKTIGRSLLEGRLVCDLD